MTGDHWLALIDAAPGSPVVPRIWQHFGTGAAADTLLAGLIADGSEHVPAFALLMAEAGGQHRLFCRGAVGATIVTRSQGDEGNAVPERIDGAGFLTWCERVIVNAERIFLGPPPDSALRLPAASGVVLAGCVIVDFTGSASWDTMPDALAPLTTAQPKMAQPKKTIVFFPDTITINGPGGILGQPAAGPAAAAQDGPGDRTPTYPVPVPSVPAPPAPPAPAAAPGAPHGPGDGHRTGHAYSAVNADGAGEEGAYDYLWGATQARSVADAAIGLAGDGGQVPPGPPSGPWPMPGNGTGPGAWQAPGNGTGPGGTWSSPAPDPGPPPLPPQLPPPLPGPGPASGPPGPRPPGPPSGLIDVPPWLSGAGGTAPAHGAARQDHSLFQPDLTMKRGDLSALAAAAAPPDRIGPTVPALICPAGHLNPPNEANCRRCGAALPLDPVLVPRPVLGVLRLSLGDVITLDRGVIMGRNPRTDFAGTSDPGGEERPHVVKLPSAEGDVSRTHLRVTLDGWHVLVTDLNSTNGTLVTLPGRDPEQLRPGEPLLIRPGTVVTLAEGIDFRFEVPDPQ